MIDTITSQRLVLRPWEDGDAQELIRIAGQQHVEHWLPDWREYDKHAAGWIKWAKRLYLNDDLLDPFTSWAITLADGGALIGQINVGRFDDLGPVEPGLGYFMDAAHCGKGYMTEAVNALAGYLFDEHGYGCIIATVQPGNAASLRVVEKAGFRYIKTIPIMYEGQEEALPFRYYRLNNPRLPLERMDAFFAARVDGYDEHMMKEVEGCKEAYELLPGYLPDHTQTLLDLGCGTGLELDGIFARFPLAHVTGIDLTREMLDRLALKYYDRRLTLIYQSYFDVDFGVEQFDAALSVQSLHHFSHEEKRGLYARLCRAIKPGGRYVECDYMVLDQAEEDRLFAQNARMRREQGVPDGAFYHFDTPCTVENQVNLLLAAGFQRVSQPWRKGNTTILIAEK